MCIRDSWTVVALVFVGLGTGGIKPCVSTFGADQIDGAVGDASEATRRYFAVFYASINLGSVFSYLLVPAMRAIFGYAAAFAVPAVLLAAAEELERVAGVVTVAPVARGARAGVIM